MACGHVNKHTTPNLVCEKDKGHEGNHGANQHVTATQFSAAAGRELSSAFVAKEEPTGLFLRDGRPETRVVYEGDMWVEWKDAAGVPVNEIVPGSPGIEVINAPLLSEKETQRI